MRSILGKILCWLAGTLVLGAVSFVVVSVLLIERRARDPLAAALLLQLEGATRTYEARGAPALEAYLERLHRDFGGRYHLADAAGRDVLTGEDRSPAIAGALPRPALWPPRRSAPVVAATADGRYHFIAFSPHPIDVVEVSPYYVWIPLAIVALAYLLAKHLAAPARRLRDTVERFGRGDLSVRCHSASRDEFGDLARVFDRMADRIEGTLENERRLLRDVAHEIRSPLARLKYAVELAGTDQGRDTALAHIRKDIDRMASIASDLLETTRPVFGPAASGRDVPLGALVAEVAADCRRDAESESRPISVDVPPGLRARADPERVRRAVENLVRNGLLHTPPGTPVEIRAVQAGDVVRLTVRDWGPGVPPAELERIFRPFHRLDEARRRETGGTGLGLAIAERAIAEAGGRIAARNMNPGLEIAIDLPC